MTFKSILLSGIPGTGKTTIAKHLNKKYQYDFLSIGELVIKKKLYSEIDEKRNTKIVDSEKLTNFIDNFLQEQSKDIILECHYIDMIEHPSTKIAFILRCHPEILESRLKERNYSEAKIKENIQAEILGDSTSYMLQKKKLVNTKKIFELDTTHLTLEESVDKIHQIILNPEDYDLFLAGKISWISNSNIEKYL